MRKEYADITTVRRGDIVRFASYALRVEADPILGRNGSSIKLTGRTTEPGCPLATKSFMRGRTVTIERAG